jgi:hypothetical protein
VPISVSLDRKRGVRTTMMSGTVTDAELFDAAAAVIGDPRFTPAHRALIDLTRIEQASVTPAGLEHVAGLLAGAIDPHGAPPRVAVVVTPAPEVLALVRQYERLAAAARVPYDYRVFEATDEARHWLGIG